MISLVTMVFAFMHLQLINPSSVPAFYWMKRSVSARIIWLFIFAILKKKIVAWTYLASCQFNSLVETTLLLQLFFSCSSHICCPSFLHIHLFIWKTNNNQSPIQNTHIQTPHALLYRRTALIPFALWPSDKANQNVWSNRKKRNDEWAITYKR